MNVSPESAIKTPATDPEATRCLICAPGWLGDCLMALPAISALCRIHQPAAITVLCKPSLQTLWELYPEPLQVLDLQRGLNGARQTVARLRDLDCAQAIIFPNSFRSAWLTFAAGIPCRRGLAGHWRRWLLTEIVPTPSDPGKPVHQSREYDAIANVSTDGTDHPLLSVPAPYRSTIAQRWENRLRGPVLTIFPGAARGPAKQWPESSFAALGSRWIERTKGTVLIAGTASERPLCDLVKHQIGGNAINLAGRTSLPELAALIELSAAVAANDSGGAHLAAALNRPLVVIFGHTDPAVTAPRGRLVRIVARPEAPGSRRIARQAPAAQALLAAIPVDAVFDALMELAPEHL